MKTEADAIAGERKLRRLGNFIDVIYAVVIVLVVYDLPRPQDWADRGMVAYLEAAEEPFLLGVLIIAIVLIYWVQSNILLGKLAKTNALHACISILQVVVILLLVIWQDFVVVFDGDPLSLAIMSVLAAVLGSLGAIGWWYASQAHRLLLPVVTEAEVRNQRVGVLAEPLCAVVTLPFAFVSITAWNVSWLSYLLIAAYLKRWRVPVD
ncbi:MAG: TMEM175 family protein [Kiloniellales bacterium]|nr:TMEM175 family protein [Kiloniellales bacterium]MDJ0981553.1 TMEM175 family protein [Kiloniellales bacterium]